jgi:hypothetical protein
LKPVIEIVKVVIFLAALLKVVEIITGLFEAFRLIKALRHVIILRMLAIDIDTCFLYFFAIGILSGLRLWQEFSLGCRNYCL